MLVLTRRRGESIRIDDDVTITVSDIRREQVTLTIEVPDSVPVRKPPKRATRRSIGGMGQDG